MRLAATVSADGTQILPLALAPTVRILDTQTNQTEEYPNPGYQAPAHPRRLTVDSLPEHRVDVLAVVPNSACGGSVGRARQAGIRFMLLPEGATWNDVKEPANAESLVDEVPPELRFRHGPGHVC
jgi:predicted Fe-Mo cluster-binding NifX family protein